MSQKQFGPSGGGAPGEAEIGIRKLDGANSNHPSIRPQLHSIGADAAPIAVDPVFQRKVRRALRNDRQRVAFAAEIAATFGRAELEAMLGRYAGLSDKALTLTGGDRIPKAPLDEVAP
jgi:hypothetical protein